MLSLAAVTAIDRIWHLSEHVNAHRAAAHIAAAEVIAQRQLFVEGPLVLFASIFRAEKLILPVGD